MDRENHVRGRKKSPLRKQRICDDEQAPKSHGSVREMVQHPLRQISGLVKTDPLFQGVGALQSGMAEWIMDLDEKTGGTSGLLGCAAPRPHARAKKRTIGRHWLFLDEDTQNGSSMHEKA